MVRSRIVVGVTVMAVSATLGLAGTAQATVGGRSAAPAPHIVARPQSVPVNSTTALTGTHFPASTAITLEECSQSMWVVTANPCVKGKALTVQTNAQGQFKATFTIHRCRTGNTAAFTKAASTTAASTKAAFPQTCDVGEPHPSGIDTITLQGAVAITVSRS